MKIMQVKNLTKKYHNGEGIDQLSFSIHAGEIVALLGPNGAGKTTTIRCITGLYKSDNGDIEINGLRPGDNRVQRMVTLLPDQPYLYPSLTVAEHLQFRAKAFNIKENIQEKVQEALKKVNMEGKADRITGQLSRGQKQRAVLAGAIIQDALLYILDEPTVGLDIPSKQWLSQWLINKAKNEGAAALVSTHSLDFVLETAHRVLLIRDGILIKEIDVPENQKDYLAWKQEVIDLLGDWSDD